MKHYLLATALLAAATPALADSWVGPGQQPIVFTATHPVGDGTDSQGGIAPGYSLEPADIADNFTASLFTSSGGVSYTSSAGAEAKFRSVCVDAKTAQFDPIVAPGVAVFGHLHTFFGNTGTNPNSTYSSLRTTGGGTCGGGPLNRTAYWRPAAMRDKPSGVTVVWKADQTIIYYSEDATNSPKLTRIPRNFAYISGVNPADPNNTRMTNALIGAPAYMAVNCTYPNTTNCGTGFGGWACLDTTGTAVVNGSNAYSPNPGEDHQPYLRDASGHMTLNCPAGGRVMAEINADNCWDGHNLHSPDGRHHVSQMFTDNNTGQKVCPDGWYRIPTFTAKFMFSYADPSEVGELYLSSDRMDYGAPDPTSKDPCRRVSNHFCNGATMHFDWFGAWSYGTGSNPSMMLSWMIHGLGIRVRLDGLDIAGDPHQLDYSSVSTSLRMISDSPSPDTSLAPNGPDGKIVQGHWWGHGPENQRYFSITPGTILDMHMTHKHTAENDAPIPAADQLSGALPMRFSLGR